MRYDLRDVRYEKITDIVQRMSKISQKPTDIVNALCNKIPAIKPVTTNSRGDVLMICL